MADRTDAVCMLLGGDVMTGRGIDQILPHPGDPVLYEPYVRDAREYVRLAEAAHGPIPRPVDFAYVWGDLLEELGRARTDLRIVNLETSITSGGEPWPGKGIHYRMDPRNVECITAARIDCCGMANNHVLDWRAQGLLDTLAALDGTRAVTRAGAGRDLAEAEAPAIIDLEDKGRVLVFAFGSTSSGIPREWAAGENRPGLNLLGDVSEDAASLAAAKALRTKRPGDVAIASIHWGGNWGYPVPDAHIAFAHRLIDEGFDLVHGHSSHHVKGIEVYRERLILYGCGDLLNDYEGIRGYEEFRPDLALAYLVTLTPRRGRLTGVRLVPVQSRRFRLTRVGKADARWLCDLLDRLSAPFGAGARLGVDDSMSLSWG